MSVRIALAAVAASLLAGGAAAQQLTLPEPGPGDPRIRTVVYNPNDVIALRGHLGYQMMIEFDPNERIENVSIGDSLSWQVTPNRKATLLFLKPVARNAATNMTVVTNLRTYAFELTAGEADGPGDPSIIFGLRFLYAESEGPKVIEVPAPPVEAAASTLTPEDYNFAYSYSGSRNLVPARVFDDGSSTYFQFLDDRESPALFMVGPDGREEMVNTRLSGRYVVVDQVARAFVLRYGRARTEVRNDAFEAAAAPTGAPPPRRGS
jgi:type IV secretion system protein VirB9